MTDLRHTETNASDDSSGRAFGLEGNLYLPVLLAVVAALGVFAILAVLLRVSYTVAGVMAAAPLVAVLGWVLLLRHGKPAGYDRDLIEHLLGGASFTRVASEQRGLAE
jgi:hypothetical protein